MTSDGAVIFGLMIGGMIFTGLFFILIYAGRFRKVPPDNVMIIYGRGADPKSGMTVVTGGGKFIVPIVQSYEMMDVSTRSQELEVIAVRTSEGALGGLIDVKVWYQFRIGDTPGMLKTAARELIKRTGPELKEISGMGVEKALREILRNAGPDAFRDRDKLDDLIRRKANGILNPQGLSVRSLHMKEIKLKQRATDPVERVGEVLTVECPVCSGMFDVILS